VPDAAITFIGCLLWASSSDASVVLELISDDDFDPALSVLVATIRGLAAAGKPCHAQIVADELNIGGDIDRGIGLALMEATVCGAVPEAARYYASAVVASSLRRKVESAGAALTEAATMVAESDLALLASRVAAGIVDCAARLAKLRGAA
jgi:replicative DNA helicase